MNSNAILQLYIKKLDQFTNLGQTANSTSNPSPCQHHLSSLLCLGNLERHHNSVVSINADANQNESRQIQTKYTKKGEEPTHKIPSLPRNGCVPNYLKKTYKFHKHYINEFVASKVTLQLWQNHKISFSLFQCTSRGIIINVTSKSAVTRCNSIKLILLSRPFLRRVLKHEK